MPIQSNSKEPNKPVKNVLSEKVKDFENSVIIGKGMVVAEIVTKESGIIVPEGFDNSDHEYYKVVKTGNDRFLETHPEWINDSLTEVGNIIISMKPGMNKIYTNNGKKYLIFHESLIEVQVKPENFVA